MRSLEDRLFTARILGAVAALAIAVYGLLVLVFLVGTSWPNGPMADRVSTDFHCVWSAARLALAGNAAGAYDWATIREAELPAADPALVTLPWVYPPSFFLLLLPFAFLPYIVAFFAWIGATLAAYVAAIYAIVPRRVVLLLALAAPPLFWNVTLGQNGFLTAALLGGALAVLPTRPHVAGMLLGLLTYKPQLGLLFPLVLVLAGEWRAIAAAAATAVALVAVSAAWFGSAPWHIFFLQTVPATSELHFSGGQAPWSSMETVYSLLRWLGAGAATAWAFHGAVALTVAVMVCRIWLGQASYEFKAAAVSAGTLIVTPYLMLYDLPAAAVPVAFLMRHGMRHGFAPGERILTVAATAALLLRLVITDLVPLGPFLLIGLLAGALIHAARPAAAPLSPQAA